MTLVFFCHRHQSLLVPEISEGNTVRWVIRLSIKNIRLLHSYFSEHEIYPWLALSFKFTFNFLLVIVFDISHNQWPQIWASDLLLKFRTVLTVLLFQVLTLKFSEKFLNSAIGEMHLYQTPLPPEGSKSCVILDPSPSVNLQIPDATETRYFSANIHLDRSLFAEVIPDNECLAAAIPEFHSFPEKTLAADQFYQIKLEHCLKSAEERKWLVVRQGCVQTGQKFEEIPHFPQATRDTAFYEVDEQYITIYSHHFTEFICTVCKKVCEQRARMFIFGSLKHVNDSTNVTVRPYICSSLYSTDIFRKVASS